MTTSNTPAPLLNGRDLLRANGLPVEGPISWGRQATGTGPGVFIVELPAPTPLRDDFTHVFPGMAMAPPVFCKYTVPRLIVVPPV